MPIYSASQLIGKTFFLAQDAPVYNVVDIDDLGDAAKPAGIMRAGSSFVMDSYLAPTTGYTSGYGITYAARAYPYFTFFQGDNYMCVMVVAGRFNIPDLTAQGTLTIQEEIAAAAAAAKEGTFAGFLDQLGLGGLGSWVKPVLLIGLAIVLAPPLIHSIQSIHRKRQP